MNIRFSVASKSPIPVTLDVAPEGADAPDVQTFNFPRFKRRDWKAWREAIDAERLDQATEGLTPAERSRLLLLYPLAPLTHADMRARIYTPEGTGHVFATCARAAGVPEHAIARAVDDGDADEIDMETVALMLCGFADPAQVAHALQRLEDDAKGEGKGDGDAGTGEPAFDPDGGGLAEPETEEDKDAPFTPKAGGSKTS